MEIEEGGLWGKEQKNVTEGNGEKKSGQVVRFVTFTTFPPFVLKGGKKETPKKTRPRCLRARTQPRIKIQSLIGSTVGH